MNAFDIAYRTIKNYRQPMGIIRLHAVLYFCQAISLERHKRPIFSESIEAWSTGPVVPEVFEQHHFDHRVSLDKISYYTTGVRPTEQEHDIMRQVYKDIGLITTSELRKAIFNEMPWAVVRRGLEVGERGSRVITRDSMRYRQTSLDKNKSKRRKILDELSALSQELEEGY